MDRTLLLLLIASGVLITLLAPHATLMVAAIVTLSTISIRLFWAVFQSFEDPGKTRRAFD